LKQDNLKLLDAVNYVKDEYKAVVEANDKLKALYLDESRMWDDNKNKLLAKIKSLKTNGAETERA
jgi:hypothetical protein